MDLIVTKWIAMEATVLLAKEKKEELLTRFPSALLYTAQKQQEQMTREKDQEILNNLKVTDICPLGEGGIFTALWRLGEELGAGMEVDLRKIPVKQETIEICEHFDINPYNVCSEGSILAAAKEGAALVEALVREGVPATLIGRLTDGNDRILWNDGNKRFLDRPQRDEIDKVKLK
jgi:hydrogenase maturation factor